MLRAASLLWPMIDKISQYVDIIYKISAPCLFENSTFKQFQYFVCETLFYITKTITNTFTIIY